MVTHHIREEMPDPAVFLAAARDAVEGGRADARLQAVAALRVWLPNVERDAVAQAVAAGASWARIADALGVTRQTVHEKHAALRPVREFDRRSAIVKARAEWVQAKADQARYAREYFERLARRRADG